MTDPISSPKVPVGSYARVSSYKQIGGRFESCDAQLEVCREFIARHSEEGWFEAESFVDPAYTGKNLDRPGMRALQEAIVARRVKVVVAYKVERMLRSTDEWPSFRRFLKENGCQMVSVSEGVAEETASGRLKTNMLVSVAAYERENTAEKVRRKMGQQAKRGIWNGGLVPFGFTYDPLTKMLQPDPVEAPLVRYLYGKVAELVSLTALAEELNAKSMRTRVRSFRTRDGTARQVGGRRFRSDWLRMMIRNPIYRGVIRYGREEFKGLHPALVDADLWEAANAAICQTLKPALCQTLGPLSRRTGPDKHFNLLKGLLACGECGRAMVPQASGKRDADGKPYRYYVCGGLLRERGDTCCCVRRVSAAGVERCVVAVLGKMAGHPDVVAAVLGSGRTKARSQLIELEKKLPALNREITQVTQQMNNVVDALAKGGLVVLDDVLRGRVEDLRRRKDELLVKREHLEQDREVLRQEQLAPDKICAALVRFDTLWEQMAPEEKRELVELTVARVELRRSAKGEDTMEARSRGLQMQFQLHLPELLVSDGTATSTSKKKLLTIDADVQLPNKSGGEVVITAPFKHRIPAADATTVKKQSPIQREHPLRRAQRWQLILENRPDITARELAKEEGVSEAAISLTLRLRNLIPPVQQQVLDHAKNGAAYHLGLRPLAKIAALPGNEQAEAFASLVKRWCATAP